MLILPRTGNRNRCYPICPFRKNLPHGALCAADFSYRNLSIYSIAKLKENVNALCTIV